MNHIELQEQIIQLAHLLGWRHLHVRRTVGRGKKWVTSTNLPGWPDLFFWHPSGRTGPRAIEVKIPPDTLKDDQRAVLASLEAGGIPTLVARPDNLQEVHVFLAPWLDIR